MMEKEVKRVRLVGLITRKPHVTALLVLSNGLVIVLLKSSRRPYRDVTQYGNAGCPSLLSSCDKTIISAWVRGLADSSILCASYVVDINRMVLCSYIRF